MGGLLQSKTAPQLEREQIAQKEAELNKTQRVEVVDNLAAHVRKCWSIAKTHRSRQADRLTKCLRLRKGEYDGDTLRKIKEQGGSDIYMNVVGTKCRAAKSWLSDLYSGANDKPFSPDPTPVQDLDPAIQAQMIQTALEVAMQTGLPPENIKAVLQKHEQRIKDELKEEGEQRMERMSEHLSDVLAEGDYRREFEMFLDDLVTFPFAIFKGPIFKVVDKIKWVESEQGQFVPQMQRRIARKFKRVSPFDFYPSPTSTKPGDGWSIEHLHLTAQELEKMREAKGYNADAINLALRDYRAGGLREWAFNSGERETLEGKTGQFNSGYDQIDGLEFTGHIQGKELLEFGIKQPINDIYREYNVSVIVVGGHTIKAQINPDPTGAPSYYKACFRDVPGSFNGEALPEIIEDIQKACNSTARALMNNLAIGAQPQVAVDLSKQNVNAKITSIRPGKTWLYSSKGSAASGPGVTFFSPEIKSQELLNVYERFERYADERSGIPAYAYGSDNAAGAGKTASGLSMLMNAASKVIKSIVRSIDIGVIEPLINKLYQSAMLDPEVPADHKGDAQARARGSDALMHKEATAMRQLEFMQMTGNPLDMQIIGLEGRREMLETASQNSEFPAGRVVPTIEELQQRMANAQPAPGQEGDQPPA